MKTCVFEMSFGGVEIFMNMEGVKTALFPVVLLYSPCRCECVLLFCVRCRIRWIGKPTRRGPGQIGCLLFLLLFNYAALKHRGYLLTILTLQKEESTVPFIMQSANKSGTTQILTLSTILNLTKNMHCRHHQEHLCVFVFQVRNR